VVLEAGVIITARRLSGNAAGSSRPVLGGRSGDLPSGGSSGIAVRALEHDAKMEQVQQRAQNARCHFSGDFDYRTVGQEFARLFD